MTRPTKHQKEVLLRLARLSTAGGVPRPGRFVHGKDSGSPAGLEHLCGKGLAECERRVGERGGEHLYYRPTAEGYALADREANKRVGAGVAREMTTGEIDSRLIEARRDEKIVRVFVGPAAAEFRGVPGPVVRDASDGVLRLEMGARRIALAAITKVV